MSTILISNCTLWHPDEHLLLYPQRLHGRSTKGSFQGIELFMCVPKLFLHNVTGTWHAIQKESDKEKSLEKFTECERKPWVFLQIGR